jgi:hypothetical protein
VTDVWTAARIELLAMAEKDLRLRSELEADGSLFQGYEPRMRALHDANAVRLNGILDTLGWPGEPQVGREGAKAAWLIAQHAIAQPSLQRRALTALQAAALRGDVPALYAAMLEDRIRCFEGRPQRYGTQFDWDAEGQMSPLPLEDPDGVDARRKEVGLGPLAQDVRARRAALADGPDRPPLDWAVRQRELEAWCRKVGWRA